MNLSCKELKRQARETLNGRYGLPMGTFVVTQLITLAAVFPFQYSYQRNPGTLQSVTYTLAAFIVSLLSAVLSCGLIRIHLDMARGKERNFIDLFYYFRQRPDRLILAQLAFLLIIFASIIPAAVCMIVYVLNPSGFLLAIWIAVIFATAVLLCFLILSLSLVYFFLVDNESIGVIDAFRLSFTHMKGNRGRLLYIYLSFIGMALLCLLSFGIGYLWVGPYITQTNTAFYRNIIGEVS